jgi:hypothetical protein
VARSSGASCLGALVCDIGIPRRPRGGSWAWRRAAWVSRGGSLAQGSLGPDLGAHSRRPLMSTRLNIKRCVLLSLLFVILATASCSHWRRQWIAPALVVERDHPTLLRVTRMDGTRVEVQGPAITGDSLVGTTTIVSDHAAVAAGVPLSEIKLRRSQAIAIRASNSTPGSDAPPRRRHRHRCYLGIGRRLDGPGGESLRGFVRWGMGMRYSTARRPRCAPPGGHRIAPLPYESDIPDERRHYHGPCPDRL